MIIMIVITIIILRIHPAISRYISNIPLHLDKSRCLVVQSLSRNCFRWVFREVDGERQAEVTVCHLGYLGSVLQLPWWFPARKRMRMFGLMHTLGKQTRAKGIVSVWMRGVRQGLVIIPYFAAKAFTPEPCRFSKPFEAPCKGSSRRLGYPCMFPQAIAKTYFRS